ncbi:helix-turn-helix domain-containing protein [Aquimarina celericrescens]|uniref:Helix-turn-helix domain-containing protein n=1 Tax=Aquimarina celericrescens TaxID=1964542 RepID=A0ABW5AU10_9FLAO|nr:helix-turn-helix transcriptional regulator [Aquimarina celericrescens]
MEKDILIQFGERIRSLRISNKLSQEELANKTGFHRTYIGLIERGQRNLSLRNIEVFSKYFNLTVNELMNFENDKN